MMRGGRPFKIFNYMVDHDHFLQVVQKGWSDSHIGSAMMKVWQKLKVVKKELKTLHSKEFAHLDDKIECCRRDLDEIQSTLVSSPTDSDVQEAERGCLSKLKLFLKVQKSAFKQKSRVKWLQLGDSNSKNFFSAMKERHGKQLSSYDAESLIVPVTDQEINAALKGINVNKSPGLDGFNSLFFNKSWSIVKTDVYTSVKEFFNTGVLLRQVNNVVITSIPKVQDASNGVIGKIVHYAQAGFIPGRNIADNILLASELIKCYSRKNISPRCMIKVDLKKFYDYVEWPFLQNIVDT
ncbi:uncharacterized protein [Spinacia oleracea]|uniref:Reverse transcriptase domain-containing protein n=1 Tax=Spinacia oleracea TaxID=3562 RepID=A0ABM3QQM8_SPIOL|nr:uncharacterized protein LOC110800016 [Spinacia oleracea]